MRAGSCVRGGETAAKVSSLCLGVMATIAPQTRDRYGRTVARVECRGQAHRRDHEPGALGQAEWARFLCLPEGCDGAPARAAGHLHRGIAATSLTANSVGLIRPLVAAGDMEARSYLVPTTRIIEPVRASKIPTSITRPGRRAS
jgi:hypothetical protein